MYTYIHTYIYIHNTDILLGIYTHSCLSEECEIFSVEGLVSTSAAFRHAVANQLLFDVLKEGYERETDAQLMRTQFSTSISIYLSIYLSLYSCICLSYLAGLIYGLHARAWWSAGQLRRWPSFGDAWQSACFPGARSSGHPGEDIYRRNF